MHILSAWKSILPKLRHAHIKCDMSFNAHFRMSPSPFRINAYEKVSAYYWKHRWKHHGKTIASVFIILFFFFLSWIEFTKGVHTCFQQFHETAYISCAQVKECFKIRCVRRFIVEYGRIMDSRSTGIFDTREKESKMIRLPAHAERLLWLCIEFLVSL